MPDARREFYVGYAKSAPPATARFVRRVAGALLLAGAGLGAAIAAGQGAFGEGTFEFGRQRTFVGEVRITPYPTLLVERPGRSAGPEGSRSRYSLVAVGKHGATRLTTPLDGRRASLEGSLIFRGSDTMVEVAQAQALPGEGPGAPPVTDYGRVRLQGEIVDSKCYFGVMKPGRGRPHRACAELCIRGGIPPVLAVETNGTRLALLLVDEAGRAVNDRVLGLVAEPVEIAGRLLLDGDTWMLAADPAAFRRLGAEERTDR